MLYHDFNRKQWINYFQYHLTLPAIKDGMIKKVKKINKNLSMREIQEIYFPISELLNFYFEINLKKKKHLQNFFTKKNDNFIFFPYIVGISGSVAAGKSTIAQIFQTLLSNCFYRRVEVVATDGFLHPNYVLEKKNLIKKKGFPETYNNHKLINFIKRIRSGTPHVSIPIYSHFKHDVLLKKRVTISHPEILILEGLNVLQNKKYYFKQSLDNVSILDFIDFSIYIDASKGFLKNWYIQRILCRKRYNGCVKSHNFFEIKVVNQAKKSWEEIHFFNLRRYILPTRNKANLILRKNSEHAIFNLKFQK